MRAGLRVQDFGTGKNFCFNKSGSFEQPKPEILLGSCLLNSCVYFFNCFFTADDCPLPHCAFPCPRGSYYMRDSYGCQTCQCGGNFAVSPIFPFSTMFSLSFVFTLSF